MLEIIVELTYDNKNGFGRYYWCGVGEWVDVLVHCGGRNVSTASVKRWNIYGQNFVFRDYVLPRKLRLTFDGSDLLVESNDVSNDVRYANIEEDAVCCICLRPCLYNITTLKDCRCSKMTMMHTSCVTEWLARCVSCPICRAQPKGTFTLVR
jgi:hypothetical protein